MFGFVLRLGSQFKSFIFNVSPTEHASCRTAPKPRLFSVFTRPYPSLPEFPRLIHPVSPQWGANELRKNTRVRCAGTGGISRLALIRSKAGRSLVAHDVPEAERGAW